MTRAPTTPLRPSNHRPGRHAALDLSRQYTARVMSESIDELETEFEKKKDDTLAANRFRELMDALDVDEGAQQLALAILKEEGLHAVQVQRACLVITKSSGEGRKEEPLFMVGAASVVAMVHV